MFAIAVDQPFRFPANFTFVLRAFSTLEGIGKTLNPEYKFSDVAQPYAQELLDLQNTGSQRDLLFNQVRGLSEGSCNLQLSYHGVIYCPAWWEDG